MSHHTTAPSQRVRRFLPEPIETITRTSKSHQSVSYVGTQSHEQGGTEEGTRPSTESPINIEPSCSTASEVHSQSPLQSNNYLVRQHTGERHATKPPRLPRTSYLSGEQNESIRTEDNSLQLRPRKFVPQLMETASRSFRRDPSPYATPNKCRSELESTILRHISASGDAPTDAGGYVAYESPFSYSRIRHRQETRRHSFRVPDLPVIPSSGSEGSEGSDLPSLPVSPSISSRQSVIHPKVEEDRRESCDELFSSYLLSLAARSAEKQLREQALAAFPNEQVYQPVDHFAIDREEEDCSSQEEPMIHGGDEVLRRYRRASSTDLPWELEYMRQHKEEAEMRDRAMAGTQGLHLSPVIPSTYVVSGLVDNHLNLNGDWERDCDPVQQRHVTSPPMLGNDLVFPRSLSPEATFCESRNLSGCNSGIHDFPGLWHATPHLDDQLGGDGLWMGTCKPDRYYRKSQDYLSHSTLAPTHRLKGEAWVWPEGAPRHENEVPVKPRKKFGVSDGKERNSSEGDTDHEFQDAFVTQVYNYLSLGYPCVARYYDHELSKVSGISVADLRRDDMNADAKGYVGNAETTITGATDRDMCMRWLALRSYIREWARQQPVAAEDDGSYGTWGVRERRGSWAG
ncbi:hypothetical protein BDV23DRAFT_20468 [Aspergillus alliaceus]|uniref:Uncharacterized protein n=1 Tax=Petromyces alliaceus TaxID=209559 RepID=A0A5N7BUG1_PETAA|nr:hypothetical protein BDV23DRAFT_20468 [Aspergillus alliaceus]